MTIKKLKEEGFAENLIKFWCIVLFILGLVWSTSNAYQRLDNLDKQVTNGKQERLCYQAKTDDKISNLLIELSVVQTKLDEIFSNTLDIKRDLKDHLNESKALKEVKEKGGNNM